MEKHIEEITALSKENKRDKERIKELEEGLKKIKSKAFSMAEGGFDDNLEFLMSDKEIERIVICVFILADEALEEK